MTTHSCNRYDNESKFQRLKVIELPLSFVGLTSTQRIDLEDDITTDAYLRTMCNGKLMKFEEAREISATHRAYYIESVDKRKIDVIFKPTNECILKAKRNKQFSGTNRFVFDLRTINVTKPCCLNENHAESGRFYISSQFEYCNIKHSPKILNFGEVHMNNKVTQCIILRNDSEIVGARFRYVKTTGFHIIPEDFIIPPLSSKTLQVSLKATGLKMRSKLCFQIFNLHNTFPNGNSQNYDENHLIYTISAKSNVIYIKRPKIESIESLHKLYEKNLKYTFVEQDEILRNLKRTQKAIQFLKLSKTCGHKKQTKNPIFNIWQNKCCSDMLLEENSKFNELNPFEVFSIYFNPFIVDFGKVGLTTYAKKRISLRNNTEFNICINFLKNQCILYTEDKLSQFKTRVKSSSEYEITIFCLGLVLGNYEGAFEYTINNKFHRKQLFCLQVGNPTLMIKDRSIKLGMITNENFITSACVKIYNHFNARIDFKWDAILNDVPFEIIPTTGSVSEHSCKICDILYILKSTKTKTHEINLISQSETSEIIPLELSIITKKLSVKFLQPAIIFKDIAINVETVEKVKLENSSREICVFHVVEPLIPGLRMEPMYGTLRPKTILTFDIIAKILCFLEFSFEICVKINNKENVFLPVSGNVAEPKILINPKTLTIGRIPANMVYFLPITLSNMGPIKTSVNILSEVEELSTHQSFDVYDTQANEMEKVSLFSIEGGQSKTVYVKVCDSFRREYDFYVPFQINNLLGPPIQSASSTELHYYTHAYEMLYENNHRVRLKNINRDISYCRLSGVITIPWIQFSTNKFEIQYNSHNENTMYYSIKNISKNTLFVTILTSKLAPNFSLELQTINTYQSTTTDSAIRLELDLESEAMFLLKFHPKGHGKFVSTAIMFLDKQMTIPYSNLTFKGIRDTPEMRSNLTRIIFPPCKVGHTEKKKVQIKMEGKSESKCFSCVSKEESNLIVKILDCEIIENKNICFTQLTVLISVCSKVSYARNITLNFSNENGASCDIDVYFCFTHCPLTLHANLWVTSDDNPYPFYPLDSQTELYEYMESCTKFLEKWMFLQGFRKDFYPVIPEAFHAISYSLSSQTGGTSAKTKGINVSFMNFIKRIAGPLMKHIHKVSSNGLDEKFKSVSEIHDTYKEIIKLMKARGVNLWILQPKFLLSYEQFTIYSKNIALKCNSDILFTEELLKNVTLFNRLNKQCWIDFIIQSYKVFVMNSCFFECVCVTTQQKDIVKTLVDWYNEQIKLQCENLGYLNKPLKVITNLTTDLSDGVAIASAILNYCPFLREQYSLFCNVEGYNEGDIIHNACLNIDAMSYIRLNFPIISTDFLKPNFLQMLFLSIHIHVTLPMFVVKEIIKFNPPLLRGSTRLVAICPASQETLTCNYILLNNHRKSFVVEKSTAEENGKKMYLNVRFTANFTQEETVYLLIHGYNKTRIFDTYIVFILKGSVGSFNPLKKCKVTGPMYRANKVDVLVSSPFQVSSVFRLYLTDIEPTIPVKFEEEGQNKFHFQRLNLIDKEVYLSAMTKDGENVEQKVYLQMYCLSSQIGSSWIWFKSDVGEFYIRLSSHPRWDMAIDTFHVKISSWPLEPCSCGEVCECYRTANVTIPHRNDLMLRSLRHGLLEHSTNVIMETFDKLIDTVTGKVVLSMLLEENGTNMSEVQHLLNSDTTFRISSRTLIPRVDMVTLKQHSGAVFNLPVTVKSQETMEKHSITFTSECGMDIRTYRIIFVEDRIAE